MTYAEADERAIAGAGEAIKTWARAQTDRLLAQGASEAEAIASINAIASSPDFVAWMEATRRDLRLWFLSSDTGAPGRLQ